MTIPDHAEFIYDFFFFKEETIWHNRAHTRKDPPTLRSQRLDNSSSAWRMFFEVLILFIPKRTSMQSCNVDEKCHQYHSRRSTIRYFQKRTSRLFKKNKDSSIWRIPRTESFRSPSASTVPGAYVREDGGIGPPWSWPQRLEPVLHSHPPIHLRRMKLPRKLHLLRFVVTQVYKLEGVTDL